MAMTVIVLSCLASWRARSERRAVEARNFGWRSPVR